MPTNQTQSRPGIIDRFIAYAGTEKNLIGASIFRVLAGVGFLYQLLISYYQRHFIFGPHGISPIRDGSLGTNYPLASFLQYLWTSAPASFELLYHLSIAVALLWTIGWRTRWLSPLVYLLFWSFHGRFPTLWDGGDNLMHLVLFYSMFANLGAYFSIDAGRDGARRSSPAASMMHNAAILAFAMQLCLVYGIAGLTKVQGPLWQNGTALYYPLRAGDFAWPAVNPHVYSSMVLLVLSTYATVAFQILFTPLLFLGGRKTRVCTIAVAVSFHVAIMSCMGLMTFGLFMMAVDLAMFADEDYLAAVALARRAIERMQRLRLRLRRVRPARLTAVE